MTATFVGMPKFPVAARAALEDTQLRRNLAHATATIRDKRARVVAEVENWEELRLAGAAIKDAALFSLDEQLVLLEERLTAAGATVRWARDAEEACAIVAEVAKSHGIDEVVKVKSMVTQEIGLNEALAGAGHRRLGDRPGRAHRAARRRPAQPHPGAGDPPQPCRDPGDLPAPDGPADDRAENLTDEPAVLAGAARVHLREKFLNARMAVSGANFAVAETGTLVVVESEGNGRMCLTLPEVLVSVVGIEKVVPTWEDLDVFLRLLPRSSTGERMNPYTSTWTGRDARRRPAGGRGRAAGQRPHPRAGRPGRPPGACAASAARPA